MKQKYSLGFVIINILGIILISGCIQDQHPSNAGESGGMGGNESQRTISTSFTSSTRNYILNIDNNQSVYLSVTYHLKIDTKTLDFKIENIGNISLGDIEIRLLDSSANIIKSKIIENLPIRDSDTFTFEDINTEVIKGLVVYSLKYNKNFKETNQFTRQISPMIRCTYEGLILDYIYNESSNKLIFTLRNFGRPSPTLNLKIVDTGKNIINEKTVTLPIKEKKEIIFENISTIKNNKIEIYLQDCETPFLERDLH